MHCTARALPRSKRNARFSSPAGQPGPLVSSRTVPALCGRARCAARNSRIPVGIHRRQRVHGLEARLERGADRTLDPQRQVAPAAGDAIARVLRADVVSADDGGVRVAHQELAVVAEREPQPARRAEHAHRAARLLQRREEIRRQPFRAEGVIQHPHLRAAPAGAHELAQQRVGGLARPHDVALQAHGFTGRGHQFQHRREGGVAIGQPAGTMPVEDAVSRGGRSHRQAEWTKKNAPASRGIERADLQEGE